MEAAAPIKIETPKPSIEEDKINFIEELLIKNENNEYKIQFGITENKNELVMRIISKDIFCYQHNYNINQLRNLSKIFALYETVKEIILFLKNLNFEISEKNEQIILKFNAFMPDGKSKLIEFELKKKLMNSDYIIKYLSEEIQSIKANMKLEISNLKQNFLNRELDYKKEISNLKEENKKLWDEINQLKILTGNLIKNEKQKNSFVSKITSKNSIEFILSYISENDKSFKFNEINLLYRGSRDGDRTKTCHQLCDNKQNVLIIMQSDTGHIFGGYSKIGFKVNNNRDYKIDNKCFLFSIDSQKIYPVIKDSKVICHIDESNGLCFYASLCFFDKFMNKKYNNYHESDRILYFNGLEDKNEMNGGNIFFKYKEIEVFQLI